MIDLTAYEAAIQDRLSDLGARVHDIDAELSIAKPKDLEEQAVDLEDDEVLESLGHVAQKEIALLKRALMRIRNKTYGICRSCEEPISEERLKAVLYAPLCRTCAGKAANSQ